LTTFPKPNLSPEVKDLLAKAAGNGNGNGKSNNNVPGGDPAFPATTNPSMKTAAKKPTQNLRRSQIMGAR